MPTTTRTTTPRELARAVTHPAVLVLVLAGAAAVLSDTRALDGLGLLVMAGVLVRDELGRPAAPARAAGAARVPAAADTAPPDRWQRGVARAPGPVVVAAIGAAALVAAAFERYSWPVTVVVWGAVAVTVRVEWPEPASDLGAAPDPRDRRTRPTAWVVLGVLGALWELGALVEQPDLLTGSWEHPTLSVLADPALATGPGRAVALAGWLLAGWWLCRRVAR